MHVVRRVAVRGAGVDVRPRLSENARYPVVWELLERRILWSASGNSSTLAALAALAGEAAFGSFANNGTVRVEGTLVEGTRSIALQTDGKMVVAAWSGPKTPAGKVGIDQATSVTLIRLNRGGTLDTSLRRRRVSSASTSDRATGTTTPSRSSCRATARFSSAARASAA
jgi:hypothetical protein